MVGSSVGAAPKSLARPLPPRPTVLEKKAGVGGGGREGDLPGLDREIVRSALTAGIPMEHLKEMSSILQGKPRRLDELPRRKEPAPAKRGPLSESEGEEEELEADVADTVKSMEILAEGRWRRRLNAAAMRALQRCLVEDPAYLYKVMEANLQSDFLSRPVQPGEPLTSGTTIRGWLASRCGLLLAAAEQASIDGGNWVVSNAETFLGHLKDVDPFTDCQEETGERQRTDQRSQRERRRTAKSKTKGKEQGESRERQEGPRCDSPRRGGQCGGLRSYEHLCGETGPGAEGVTNSRSASIHVPGSSASTFSGRGVLQSLLRHMMKGRCRLGSFSRSLLARQFAQSTSAETGQKEIFPMPLPYPEVFLAKDQAEDDRCTRKKAVVAVVITLNYLFLNRAKEVGDALGGRQKLTRAQWDAVRRIERFLEAWVLFHLSHLKSWAGRLARLVFVGRPQFDPSPYLDPISKVIYNDPLSCRLDPASCPVQPPKLRVHCSRQEKVKLFSLLDASDRLRIHLPHEFTPEFGSGLFAVPKDLERDRLILDSRGANLLETSPQRWIRSLASSEVLCRMTLEDSEVLASSSNDLRDFYYLFQASKSRSKRNVLVGALHSGEVQHLHACKPEHMGAPVLYGALASLAKGDARAVELAQSCHLGLALPNDIITSDNLTAMCKPAPREKTSIGLVIDDFDAMSKVQRAEFGSSLSEGAIAAEKMQERYEEVKLIPNQKKSFRDELNEDQFLGALMWMEMEG
eukprot:s66_g31.t1